MSGSIYKGRFVIRAALFSLLVGTSLLAQASDLEGLSARGKELMAASRFEEATAVYREMLTALPGNVGLLLNLALAEEMAGHPADSIPHFQAVLRTQPDNIPALTSLSMARLQMNEPGAAMEPLTKLLKLQPDNTDARGMLAGAALSIKHYAEAASEYRTLSEITRDDPRAWYGLGKAYEALAAARFNSLTKAAPQSGYVASLVGDARQARRQYRSAFFFYKEAQKSMPDLPGLHAELAHVYRETGHGDWAEKESVAENANGAAHACAESKQACDFLQSRFLQAAEPKVTASAKTPESLFWSARAYNALATAAFDRLDQLPASLQSHAIKAQVFHDHGQDLQAAAEWRAALMLAPDTNDPQLKTELANSLFLGRDYQSVMPILKDLLGSRPGAPDLNFMLGESLWRTQQAEMAIAPLQKALRADPKLLPAHAALGLALVSLNRNSDALPHLEQALSLDDDGSLHYSLARAYGAAGNADKARLTMQQYSAIQKRNNDINGELAKEAEIVAPAATPVP